MRDSFPANIYLLIVNNRNTKKKVWNMFKVNNKQRRQRRHSGAFIVNFEDISHLLKATYKFFSSQ